MVINNELYFHLGEETMKIEKESFKIIMNDGAVYERAYNGVIGISHDLHVSGGFDSDLSSEDGEIFCSDEMPSEHKKELADFMIDAWKRYKEKA